MSETMNQPGSRSDDKISHNSITIALKKNQVVNSDFQPVRPNIVTHTVIFPGILRIWNIQRKTYDFLFPKIQKNKKKTSI